MRLLTYDNNDNLHTTRDLAEDEIKPYAILSHTWGKDEEEVTLQQIGSPDTYLQKPGSKKIDLCGKQARQDGLQYFWVDTCCVDKTNHVELSKAITLMYRWYQQAQTCYVYLADVSSQHPLAERKWESCFRQSRWFTRGWTLQELLAPRTVVFYSKEWHRLGTKEELKDLISSITGIPTRALEGQPLSQFSVIERMRWTHGRQTKEKEDQAYCLLGMFGISMSLRYGEGDNAFRRLQKKLDAQSNVTSFTTAHDYIFQNPVGLCLVQAPSIERKHFIGRDHELGEMEKMLQSEDAMYGPRRLVLGGMGGVGKTQLALAYAHQHSKQYESVFWLNATTEATLATSFSSIAKRIFSPQAYQAIEPLHLSNHVHSWLSHPRNTRWLLIFDNYDDPQAYNINNIFPDTAYGSIIITTRRADLVAGGQIPLKPLQNLDEGLQILGSRSGRDNVQDDVHARRLVQQLAGLPLALATVGTFLRKSAWSFQQYLEMYEKRGNLAIGRPLVLAEYQDRTLHTTWELSYDRLRHEDPDAASFLKLFAYFDHQAIWYSLFHTGNSGNTPDWLSRIVNDPIEFDSIMQILVDYCFVETQIATQTYSIHTCVHDWIATSLGREIESWSFWYAFECIAGSIDSETQDALSRIEYAKYTPHATNLLNTKFTETRKNMAEGHMRGAVAITGLLQSQGRLSLAELLLSEVLVVQEKAPGPDNPLTLSTVHNLGGLYAIQGKLVQAESMYNRALAGTVKALGPDHLTILHTIHNLGDLYTSQGKLAEAESMYDRALAGTEKALGPDHLLTLHTVHNLGGLYADQGRLVEAEQMLHRALAARERALGPDHVSTLHTAHNLGSLYTDQGRLAEAEKMLYRALAGRERALGPDHVSTLTTVNHVGFLCLQLGTLSEAEQMINRALTGCEKALGAEHPLTLNAVANLGALYAYQGQLSKAQKLCERCAIGRQKVLGSDHPQTKEMLECVEDLKLAMARVRGNSQREPQDDRS